MTFGFKIFSFSRVFHGFGPNSCFKKWDNRAPFLWHHEDVKADGRRQVAVVVFVVATSSQKRH